MTVARLRTRTRVCKRHGGAIHTSALRRFTRASPPNRWHGTVLRLRVHAVRRRASGADRDGSDPPVRGPGTGSGPGVFAHSCPHPPGVAPIQISLQEGYQAPLGGRGLLVGEFGRRDAGGVVTVRRSARRYGKGRPPAVYRGLAPRCSEVPEPHAMLEIATDRRPAPWRRRASCTSGWTFTRTR